MKNNKLKIIVTIILFVIFISCIVNMCYAKDPSGYVKGTVASDAAMNSINTSMNKVIGFLQTIGTIVAVVTILVLGIKYMMGSTEEKAEYKKSMMPYFIGAILIFAATNIAKLVYNFMNGL